MKWKFLALGTLVFLVAEAAVSLALAASIPATVTATPAVPVLAENAYRWYANVDGLSPTTPAAVEDATLDAQPIGTQIRLRMNVANTGGAAFAAGATFILQYANSTSGPWTDVSTSTAWSFFNNPSVADGQIIVTTLLSSSTVGESYGESNPSAAMPTQLLPGDYGEWDWSLVNISATTSSNWFFRMENASGTALDSYARYPELIALAPPGGGGSSGGGSPPPIQVGGGGGTGYYQSTTQTAPPATATLPVTPPLLSPTFQIADFNGDNRIDITDLSILLYYYNRCTPSVLRYDLNRDGCVDFADVSILMYYWTGP